MQELSQELFIRLQRIARDGWQRGLTAGSGGNLSVRCGETIWITRSGSSYRDLVREDMLPVEINRGNVMQTEADRRPSIETGFHLEIYRARPKVMAVYHCHPPHAAAYAAAGKEIPLPSASDQLLLGRLAYVPAAEPGSPALAEAIAKALAETQTQKGIVLAGHGIIALGETPEQAYEAAELMENAALTGILLGLLQKQNTGGTI